MVHLEFDIDDDKRQIVMAILRRLPVHSLRVTDVPPVPVLAAVITAYLRS